MIQEPKPPTIHLIGSLSEISAGRYYISTYEDEILDNFSFPRTPIVGEVIYNDSIYVVVKVTDYMIDVVKMDRDNNFKGRVKTVLEKFV